MLCRRQLGTRSSSLLEKRKNKLVWMQKRKGAEWHVSKKLKRHSKRRESSVAQRGKGVAKQCMTRRVRTYSKAAHDQESQNVQQERGVVKRRSGEPSKC